MPPLYGLMKSCVNIRPYVPALITPIPIPVNSGLRMFSLGPGESMRARWATLIGLRLREILARSRVRNSRRLVAASGVGSRAMVSTMVVAGPSNASAAATARIHDARLFVVATNPVLNPKASRHDDEDEDGGSMGLRPGSLTHRDASGERLTLYPLIRLD